MALQDSSVALIVAGDAQGQEHLTQHLRLHGWQVVTVSEGAAALAELRTRPITLVVIRTELPDMTGPEVIASAQAAGWHAGVIFIDTQAREEMRSKCEALGALAYLVEPVSTHTFQVSLARRRPSSPERTTESHATEDLLLLLEPGMQADLCIRTGAAAGSYVATVSELGPASLSVLTQSRDGTTLYIGLGTPVYVGFPTRQGWAEFEARVSSSCIRNTQTELALARPARVTYRQRRRWPRLQAIFPIRAWPTNHPDRAGVMVAGQTEDVGKHGLKACFSAPLPESESVTLALDGGNGLRELRLSGRPVWEQPPAEPSDPKLYRYGFEFTHLTPALRLAVDELLGRISAASENTRTGAPSTSFRKEATTRSQHDS